VKDNNIKNTCETLFHNPEMAFFNLTALGPQSVYKSLLKNRSLLHIFDEEDIQKAFDQIQLEGSSRQRACYRFLRIFSLYLIHSRFYVCVFLLPPPLNILIIQRKSFQTKNTRIS
jgi:hypothetical protein